MNRRELLKSILPLASIPVVVKGEEVGKAFKVDPDAKYEVFINHDMIDVEEFCNGHHEGLPAGTPVHCVFVPFGRSMDDAIRIYKVKG